MRYLAAVKRLALSAVLTALAVPSTALASPSVHGAIHAVVEAVAEEGGNTVAYGVPQVHCRLIAPSRFGCSFLNLRRSRDGRVTVTYRRGHYYVGEARYEPPPEYVPLYGQ
jgi:hypothetical protein